MNTTVNTTIESVQAMGKEALRATCRQLGISYGKLNNAGMRDAIIAAQPAQEPQPAAISNLFDQSAALAHMQSSSAKGQQIVDGKRVETTPAPVARTPRPAPTPAPARPNVSRKGYTIEKEREVRNGVKRPSKGTLCGSVWDALDANPALTAADLPALADANGWNRTNVSCEFYNWRKFMGIKGRQAK